MKTKIKLKKAKELLGISIIKLIKEEIKIRRLVKNLIILINLKIIRKKAIAFSRDNCKA